MPYPKSFTQTVYASIKADWYEPDYVKDINNIPKECLAALTQEPDFNIAVTYKQGVMWDLLKQIHGCAFPDKVDITYDRDTQDVVTAKRKGSTYSPKPQYYQFFAYTAYALLHGDVKQLNWRVAYDGTIQGQDVMYAINKYGIYGLSEQLSSMSKKIMVNKFAALYARMFNVDPRFNSASAEPKKLKIADRESPMSYCADCGTIRKAWDENKIAYTPGHPEYEKLMGMFRAKVTSMHFEKSTAEDQERYLRSKGTLLEFDLDAYSLGA